MKQKTKELVKKYESKMIQYRRHFPMHPELSFQEYETAAFIEKELKSLGYEVTSGIAKTGIIADLKCSNPSAKTIAIRADIDALPVTETTGLEFCSTNNGCMHACGHDAHTAILLGVAHILNEVRDSLKGNVRLIFQPAEEHGAGGRHMTEAGVLEGVDMITGLHVWPKLEIGQAGTAPGYISAGCETVNIQIKGKGAHLSTPEQGIDAMFIAARVIDALYAMKSLNANAYDVYTFSLTLIQGGTGLNVLCEDVKIQGLLRYTSIESRDALNHCIHQIVSKTAEAHGGIGEVEFVYGYPPMKNAEEETSFVMRTIEETIGKENALLLGENGFGLALEDFAYYQYKVPGVYFLLGCRNEDYSVVLHNSNFNINETCMCIGAEIMTNIVFDYFEK